MHFYLIMMTVGLTRHSDLYRAESHQEALKELVSDLSSEDFFYLDEKDVRASHLVELVEFIDDTPQRPAARLAPTDFAYNHRTFRLSMERKTSLEEEREGYGPDDVRIEELK